MDIITYALCKKIAAGAVSGISSYRIEGLNLIMETNSGQELTIAFPSPVPSDIDIVDNHLVFTLADGSTIDAGELPIETQVSSDSGNRIVKKDNGIYVGTQIIKLTKDEYDSLPSSEKSRTDIAYFVTDDSSEPASPSVLTEDLIATVEIGSVKAGKKYDAGTSLEAIIRDMLIKEIAPCGNLYYVPSDSLYDAVTDSVEDLILKFYTIKGTYDIAKIEFYVNNAIVSTITSTTANPILDNKTYSYTYHFPEAATTNIRLDATITDVKGLKSIYGGVIKFVGRSYFGIVPESVVTPTAEDIKGLDFDTLKDKKALTFTDIEIPQDGELYKVLYAYPKSFGAITKIVDADGRDYTNSYTRNEVTVDGIDYYSYILTNGTGTSGATQKFS